MSTEFWQYKLETCWEDEHGYHDEMLCIGERIKKGTFRPCLREAVPFSSAVGAVREALGLLYSVDLFAAGYISNPKCSPPGVEYVTLAPSDAATGGVKPPAPLTIEALRGVEGLLFIEISSDEVRKALEEAGQSFLITMGAMKSTGFGRCRLTRVYEDIPMEVVKGRLRTRVPEKHEKRFGIDVVHKHKYGFLFERLNDKTGIYVKSLFEGSIVEGYSFLLGGGDAL
jgi:hypothetical protein